ncbi:MAG: STAS/SEC14 domain-containing protein [Desulfuromonas sp.]|nr:MAG: STAS/SEC14 domain-containing protein [Desulfuromonas sp.]
MPAEHRIDDTAGLIITTWEGAAVDIELIEAIQKYQDEIQLNPAYIDYNEVVDFRAATSIKLTPRGIQSLGTVAVKTDKHKRQSRLAIVVGSNLAFNLARLYVTYRNLGKNSNKEIRIFKNGQEAQEWAESASIRTSGNEHAKSR